MAEIGTVQLKRQVLSVDSRNRVNFETTTPSEYTIELDATIKNVKMIRLATTEIANSQYTVNSKNQFIDIEEGDYIANPAPAGLVATAILTPGTYTGPGLADQINTQMNAAYGVPFGTMFSVSYITETQKIRIIHVPAVPGITSRRWRLLFKTGAHGSDNLNNNMARMLGFWEGYDTAWYQDNTMAVIPVPPPPPAVPLLSNILLSDEIVMLSGENFCYLCIRGFPAVRTTARIGDVFAKIIWNQLPRNVTFDSFAANYIVYENPISRLDKFDITFREADGSLYQFNNIEHSFTIEFLTSSSD